MVKDKGLNNSFIFLLLLICLFVTGIVAGLGIAHSFQSTEFNVSFDEVQPIPNTNLYCNSSRYVSSENALYCNIDDVVEN